MQKRKRKPTTLYAIEELADSGDGEFEDYFPQSAAGEIKPFPRNTYYGTDVIWDGMHGQTVRVYPEYMTEIEGNIFDADKLAAVRDGIREAEDRVVFTAPYGTVSVVTLQDVKESIEANARGDESLDRPLTTGDDELDEFLVDPEDALSGYSVNDLAPYQADPKAAADDNMEYEVELLNDLQERLEEAVNFDEGDLGTITYTVRDGNHRAFGAILAGEPFIWMMVEDNQLQDLKDYPDDADSIAIRGILE